MPRASAIYQLYNQTIPNLILEKRTFQTIQVPWHREKSVSVPNRTYSVHRVLNPRGTDRKFSSFDFEAAARYCQLFNVHIVPLWISRETVVDYCIRSGAVMSICIMHRLNKRVAVSSVQCRRARKPRLCPPQNNYWQPNSPHCPRAHIASIVQSPHWN